MKKGFILFLSLICLSVYGQDLLDFNTKSLLKLPSVMRMPKNITKISSRASTSIDTIEISHAWYTLNWNKSKSLNTGGNLFSSFGSTSVQMSSITNYLNPKSDGSFKEVFTIYDTMYRSGLNSANEFVRFTYLKDSSISVTVDTVTVICGLFAIDSNNIAGDTISFSLYDVDKATKTKKGLINKVDYTSFSDLKKFVNGGLIYFANVPFKTKLDDSVKAFGINIEYKTVHKDSNIFLVAYNYSDSCVNVTLNGQSYRSPAMRPLFPNYTQWISIDSTSPSTASTANENNSLSYNISTIPANCRFLYTQNYYLFPSVIVESKFYGSLSTSPIKSGSFCANEAITILPDVQGGKKPFTYKWTASSGTIDNDTDPAIILTLGTTQSNVSLVVKDANGDSLVLTRSIAVSNPTVAIATPKTTLTTCKDSSIITATPATGSFSWSGGSSTTNKLTVKAAGTYSVTATNSFGCTAVSNSIVVTSTAPSITLTYTYSPNTPVCLNKDVVFTNTSSNITGWDFSWKDGTTEINTDAASFTHQFTTAGTKAVSLNATTTSGCVATPISKNIVAKTCVGIEDNKLSNQIRITPNPSRDGNFIITSSTTTPLNINITDILGKTVYSQNVGSISSKTINLGNVQNGVYFIEINNGTSSTIQKLIMDK